MNGQRNESLIENISMNEAEVSSLVEKYDQESRYRRLSGWQGKFVTFWLAAMSLFHNLPIWEVSKAAAKTAKMRKP